MPVQKTKKAKRKEAIKLRKNGFTYKEIMAQIHVAKSTLSYWVKSDLTPEEEKRIKRFTAKKGKFSKVSIRS